jgi:hypothetical protein
VRLARDLALVYHKDNALTRAAQTFLEIATSGSRPAEED